MKTKKEGVPSWQAFIIELAIYAALLVAYFIFVLHFLGGWFKELYDGNRTVYAAVALLIMIGQAVGLEVISSFLMWMFRVKK